jgi:hypothetical protein
MVWRIDLNASGVVDPSAISLLAGVGQASRPQCLGVI